MSELVELPVPDDMPVGTGQEVVAAGRIFAVYRTDSGFEVLDGICAHAGGPLGKGVLRDHVVTCPWHGWQFDVKSGENQITRSICQPRIPLLVQENRVFVRRSDLAET
ncbi:MAG: Rieske 2Fe-2S domain-containing protein [Planctomycetaceae bacterium]|nr:Rieske 2Fe-2S domain-containing protein [Planctomycetaceae bacterium]